MHGEDHSPACFCANAVLGAVSDNVFVATVFINEVTGAFTSGAIDARQYEQLAVAINTGPTFRRLPRLTARLPCSSCSPAHSRRQSAWAT